MYMHPEYIRGLLHQHFEKAPEEQVVMPIIAEFSNDKGWSPLPQFQERMRAILGRERYEVDNFAAALHSYISRGTCKPSDNKVYVAALCDRNATGYDAIEGAFASPESFKAHMKKVYEAPGYKVEFHQENDDPTTDRTFCYITKQGNKRVMILYPLIAR